MKKHLMMLSMILTILIITTCGPSIDKSLLVGVWENHYDNLFGSGYIKYTFNKNNTYKVETKKLESDPYIENGNGNYSIDGMMLELKVEQIYDFDNDELIDDENNTVNFFTIEVDETKLFMDLVFYGGDTETLVGSWNCLEERYINNELDMRNDITVNLNSDGTAEFFWIKEDDQIFFENNGTWELSDSENKIIATDSEGSFSFYFMVIDDGIYADILFGNTPVDESDYFIKIE